MLYIHQLKHLTPKSAEVESVYLVRELKQKTPFPFDSDKVQEYFSEFTLSPTDIEMIDQATVLVPKTINMIKLVATQQNSIHEPINLQRAITLLNEMPPALHTNRAYVEATMLWQEGFVNEFVSLFNTLPKLRTPEEKRESNIRLNSIFQRVLRNDQFAFRFHDIINEAHVEHISGLHESLNKGFLFHRTLEEELKKLDFASLKLRLPPESVQEADLIQENV